MASLAVGALGRMKEIWGRLNPTQRWLVGGLGLALAGAIGLAAYLNRTQWVTLVTRADPKDAAAIVARLNELKVPYQPSGDNTITIEVPKSEQYTAKLALAQSGLPKGDSVGMELFNEPKFGATEFDRKVNYLRAQQGELERALLRMAEIDYAKVQLAIPDKTVFARDQQPVTAAVLVQPRAGKRITNEQVNGIVNFVAGSVQGLTLENVKVVDQTGRLLSSGIADPNSLGTGLDNDQLQRQLTMQRDVEQRVQSMLEPIFGGGNVVARVNLELNTETSRIESTTVGQSVPKQTESSKEAAQGKQSSAAATTDPNSPPIYQGDASQAGSNDLWRTKTTTNYAVSERKETTLVTPGSVKRISVGIAINNPDLAPERIKQIQETVANAVGTDLTSVSVATMSFNRDLAASLAPSAGAAATKVQPTTLAIGLGSAAALMLVGFVLTRRRRDDEEEDVERPLDLQPQLLGAAGVVPLGSTLDVALGLEPGSAPVPLMADGAEADAMTEAEAQTTITIAPQTAKQRLELIMASKPRRQIVLDGQPVDEQLMALVDELIEGSPEACAEMLRQWLKGGS
ncbi:MAG TPA: flagellar basal-body MS-ring/collar protein FliF [Symbiobacteriaceae bacterium]|nr:flagellar basal-body MS-ring/collar protein FliF [Symbiobacteriaceae bacterium]